MPFTRLADRHECLKPTVRDDGMPLVVGDEWACGKLFNNKESHCLKRYRWVYDQREGYFWMRVRDLDEVTAQNLSEIG